MPRNDEAGFSLLETIIAFTIAAGALAALLQIYATSSSAARRSVDLLRAVEIADREIAALEDPTLRLPGIHGPVVENGLVWQMEILQDAEEELDDAAPLTLVRVALSVFRDGADAPLLQVVTARYLAKDMADGQ